MLNVLKNVKTTASKLNFGNTNKKIPNLNKKPCQIRLPGESPEYNDMSHLIFTSRDKLADVTYMLKKYERFKLGQSLSTPAAQSE